MSGAYATPISFSNLAGPISVQTLPRLYEGGKNDVYKVEASSTMRGSPWAETRGWKLRLDTSLEQVKKHDS